MLPIVSNAAMNTGMHVSSQITVFVFFGDTTMRKMLDHKYGSSICSFLGTVIGEGNGIPLQDSCLANPMDRGAWWAAVHRVTKSWT